MANLHIEKPNVWTAVKRTVLLLVSVFKPLPLSASTVALQGHAFVYEQNPVERSLVVKKYKTSNKETSLKFVGQIFFFFFLLKIQFPEALPETEGPPKENLRQ